MERRQIGETGERHENAKSHSNEKFNATRLEKRELTRLFMFWLVAVQTGKCNLKCPRFEIDSVVEGISFLKAQI